MNGDTIYPSGDLAGELRDVPRINAAGRLVRKVEGIVEDRIIIAHEGLLSGVYIYVLTGANGNSYKGKIVVR
jgi:hypothetical protein